MVSKDEEIFMVSPYSENVLNVKYEREGDRYGLAISRSRQSRILNFRQRISWMFNVLITGKPQSDFIYLLSEQLKLLLDFYKNVENRGAETYTQLEFNFKEAPRRAVSLQDKRQLLLDIADDEL